METNTIEKTKNYVEQNGKQSADAFMNIAQKYGTKAADIAVENIGKAADYTEKNVKKYPLAAVGIAVGGGVLLGTLGTLLFTPKEPSVMERINDMKLGSQLRRLFNKYSKLF